MKKLFNFRPMFLLALFFSAGITVGFLQLKYGIDISIIFFLFFIIVTTLIFLLPLIKLKRIYIKSLIKFFNDYRFHILSFFISSIAGFFLFFLALSQFNNNIGLDRKNAQVKGDIIEYYSVENGGYFLLENTAFNIDGITYKIDGKVFVYINGNNSSMPSFGQVNFTSKVSANRIFSQGKINTYAYKNKIYYNFFIDDDALSISESNPSLFNNIRKHIKNILYSNLKKENADICYALITGDSLLMDKDVKQAFISTGIAHIFSVSGLHIGVLSVAVIFLLNKLKVRKVYQLFITAAILLFYGGICNFSPSVVRATVMTLVYLISKATGLKYDALSSLALSFFLILVITPLMLFDAGFLLSFGSVFGIILLNTKLNKVFKFLPKNIRLPLSVSIAAQSGLLPVLAYFYNYLPFVSVLLNIIIIPIISIIYISLLILVVIVSVLPFLSFMFFVPSGLIEGVKILVEIASKYNYISVITKGFGIGTIVFYAFLILFSGFIFFKTPKIKRILSFILIIIFSSIAYLNALPFNYKGFSISSVAIKNTCVSIVTDNAKVYYINYGGNENSLDDIQSYLKQNNITSIEAAFFTDYNTALKQANFFNGYGVKKIAMPYNFSASQQLAVLEAENKIKYLLSCEVYTYENIKFSSYYFNNSYYAGLFTANGFNTIYYDDCSDESFNYVLNNVNLKVNMVFAESSYDFLMRVYRPDVFVTNSYNTDLSSNFYSSGTYGHLIFDIKGDKIVRKYSY